MTRRLTLILACVLTIGVPLSAQFFDIVFDPTNYANALARYVQLEQQYAQLVTTYAQIRTQYLLLFQQSQLLPVSMNARYRRLPTLWLPFAAADTYGTTAGWIGTANTGVGATPAYTAATQPLLPYGDAMALLSADEATRVQLQYDRVQLRDASIAHGLEALGLLRGHQPSVEAAVEHLEDDTYSDDPDLNTQIGVLNKINATTVATARSQTDATNVLVSLLEAQLLTATEQREATVAGINAHIAFETQAPALLAATTAETTTALTTFRIP